MEIHIPEISEMRQQLKSQALLLQRIAEQNEKKRNESEITLVFSLNERLPKYAAARFLGIKQVELDILVAQNRIETDGRKQFLAKDLIYYKNHTTN